MFQHAINDKSITHQPLLTEAERRQLLGEWNATAVPYPADQCVQQLIEQQVARTPTARAVVALDQQVSYAELNAQANQLAHYLQHHGGVGPDQVVGLCLERSIAGIVSLLAILKAGAAYVPLDPADPVERLAFIMEDTQLRVVLTEQRLLDRHPALATRLQAPPRTLVLLDTAAPHIGQEATTNPVKAVTPDHLAYVIYTSGSTGQPKGVAVPHHAVVNHNVAVANLFELVPGDRVLQFATLSFDAAVEEIFPTLQCGATLVLRPGTVLPSPADLQHLIAVEQLTILDLPTAYWHEWVADLQRTPTALPTTLRLVIVGGESAGAEHLHAWQRVAGTRIRWLNTYGPTEATVIATAYEPPVDEPQPAPTVPIGRPIANVRTYVLDANYEPVPVGVPGELYIGGVGVARGYVSRPAATAAQFLPDPFSSVAGARLYKTGDRARYQADGTLEFLGRMDDQVKIRGFRVELHEIAAVLRTHPTLHECVVLQREDVPGHPQLVAYVVPAAAAPPDVAALHAYLQQRLPAYMQPAALVVLAGLPLTANGKVDRRALPPPAAGDFRQQEQYVAPRTPQEALVATIWSQLLGVPRVGVGDDFFALGGHSLLAIQLVARLRAVCQVELPVRTVFEAPTVAALATAITAARHTGQQAELPTLTPQPRPTHLPLTPAQRRLWFLAQLEETSRTYHLPLLVEIDGPYDLTTMRNALDALVERHESLRTCFPVVGDSPTQLIMPPTPVDVEITNLANADEVQLTAWSNARIAPSFDLAHGPLLNVYLAQVRPTYAVLLLVMHHSIVDGWSIEILLHDLAACYRAATGEVPPLAPLPLQYADYTLWQQALSETGHLRPGLDYWRTQLDGLPAALPLPEQQPRPMLARHRGQAVCRNIAPDLATAVMQLSRTESLTPFMIFLAAFQLLRYRYTGQTDLAVGSPIVGRNHEALTDIVGFFVNTLVLRTRLHPQMSGHDLFATVRAVCLDAYTYQDIPFEQVVEAVQPERHANQLPLVQHLFAVQPADPEPVTIGTTCLRTLPLVDTIAKSDLSIDITPQGDGFIIDAEYDVDLFDGPTIERLIDHYLTLLAELVAQPANRIDDFALLTRNERQLIMEMGSGTTSLYPDMATLPALFEAQVTHNPTAIALVFSEMTLSYDSLNARANQLARFLQARGVGYETPVALCFERSPELIIAMLAVLKAGGMYVPLDPTYPVARLRLMLDDVRPMALVTSSSVLAGLAQANPTATEALLTSAPVLNLDDLAPILATLDASNLSVVGSAASLAYQMYTSGSTGMPKGIAIPHRGVVRLVCATNYVRFGSHVRMAHISNTAFDAATFEIWGALLHGGQLIGIPQEVVLTPSAFVATLRQQRVTTILLTVALFNQLVRSYPDAFVGMHEVLFGGEAADPVSVRLARLGSPDVTLINAYGPTENSTISTCHLVEIVAADATTVPIGQPIANSIAYVLDPQMQPVPVGMVGELYVGGPGLARGYHNRPALTAEHFIPDPFSCVAGARLYRTGDLVQRRADGALLFIGRRDQQVKIRGHRVELGEIEAGLAAHPVVRAAVVTTHRTPANDLQLIAYIVLAKPMDDEKQQVAQLRELQHYAQKHLPSSMLPTCWILLEHVPLTPNGKVDRATLPAPNENAFTSAEDSVTPRNALERLLVEIWSNVLAVQPGCIRQEFFELGGHSLMATRLLARVRDLCQVELPLRTMFEGMTIEKMAELLVAHDPEPGRVLQIAELHERISRMDAAERAQLRTRLVG